MPLIKLNFMMTPENSHHLVLFVKCDDLSVSNKYLQLLANIIYMISSMHIIAVKTNLNIFILKYSGNINARKFVYENSSHLLL